MYYVYILTSIKYKKSYVGITNNIKRRLNEHNEGYNTFSKRYKPWKVKYYENYNSRKEVRLRENYLKSCAGRRWMRKNIFKDSNARVGQGRPACRQAGAQS